MNQSCWLTPRRSSAAERTSRSMGKVTSTAKRIRVAVRYPGPRCGITIIRSTSESSVGLP
jgi:predicted RNA-binding Zn-ribbon protein involved in translation (DUF1610 family)